MTSQYSRPISFIERIWVAVDRYAPPFANQFFLEGTGDLDPGVLQRAVEVASEANPGSRVVWRGRFRKSRWVDSGMAPPVRRVQAGAWTGYSDENTPFLKVPLPIEGPTCDVTFIEGATPRLLFRSSHAVMDGRGMLSWMEDVFRVIRGEEPLGSHSTMTDSEFIHKLNGGKFQFENSRCLPPTGDRTNDEKGVAWRRLTIHGTHTHMIGKVAVAMARSAWKYRQGRFCVFVPVDLRQREPGLRSTANLSMALLLEISPDSTPEYVSERIRAMLAGKEELAEFNHDYDLGRFPLWFVSFVVKMGFKWFTRTGDLLWPCLSNVGRIDPESFSGGGFQTKTMFVLPPMSAGNAGFAAMAGVKGRFEIGYTAPRSLCADGRLDALMEDIRKMFEGEVEESRSSVA